MLSASSIRTVFISAVWYAKQGNVRGGSNLERELSDTVARLGAAKKFVYITDDVPMFPFDPEQCKYSRRFRQSINCTEDKAVFDHQHETYYPALQAVERSHPNVKLLNTAEYLCAAGVCSMASNGKLLYRDRNHLNMIGSRYVARKIVEDSPGLLSPDPMNQADRLKDGREVHSRVQGIPGR